jgi:glycosyltransferase involved in cell wall biosynthesis
MSFAAEGLSLYFCYSEQHNDHPAYPRSLVDAPPAGWSYRGCEIEFDPLKGRPWAYFKAVEGEIIHASSLISTNDGPWLFDTDHFEYLALQVGADTSAVDTLRKALPMALVGNSCLGVVAWSRAAAESIWRICEPVGVYPRMIVAYPAVLPPRPDRRLDLGPRRPGLVRFLLVDGQIGVCAQPGRKNVQAGIAAFNYLKDRGYDVELIVVDSLEPVPSTSGIRALPRLSRAQMFHVYEQVDILLFLSRQDSFGYTLTEAMYCGVCCVSASAASLPAVPELIDDGRTGFLVPYEDDREYPEHSDRLEFQTLTAVLEMLVRHPDARTRAGAAARSELGGNGRFSARQRNRTIAEFVSEALVGESR